MKIVIGMIILAIGATSWIALLSWAFSSRRKCNNCGKTSRCGSWKTIHYDWGWIITRCPKCGKEQRESNCTGY